MKQIMHISFAQLQIWSSIEILGKEKETPSYEIMEQMILDCLADDKWTKTSNKNALYNKLIFMIAF